MVFNSLYSLLSDHHININLVYYRLLDLIR
jgi:hypothetical protein